VIDEDGLDGASSGFELEAELLLERCEEPGAGVVG